MEAGQEARGEQKKACCGPSAGSRPAISAQEMTKHAAADAGNGLLLLAGGQFLMGTENPEAFPEDGEGPVREVELSPFWMDRHPVTNGRFEQFVRETGYRTEAEQFGWSFVFAGLIAKARYQAVVADTVAAAPWWCQVPGASWRMPEGPGSNIQARSDHPVVHVSWNDARNFCEWSRQRLPTEAEWEYAARGGLVQKVHPWGDKLRPEGKHMCNIWQGEFPREDTGEDGYRGTCPVEAFPANGYGLYSMTGNTWEWCADWFSADFHRNASRDNPQGPPRGEARVIRGGSFLCHHSYCNRYRVAARSSNTPDSTTSHMSFRCARSA
jgi:formylglycine-generating enzyme